MCSLACVEFVHKLPVQADALCVTLKKLSCNYVLQDEATPLWLAVESDCSMEVIVSVMTPDQIGIRHKV